MKLKANTLFKVILSSLIASSFIIPLSSCEFKGIKPGVEIKILDSSPIKINVGETYKLDYRTSVAINDLSFKSDDEKIATVDSSGLITAKSYGKTTITISYITLSSNISDSIDVYVLNESELIDGWGISSIKHELITGESIRIEKYIDDPKYQYLLDDIQIEIKSGEEYVSLNDNILIANNPGTVILVGKLLDLESKELVINIKDKKSDEPLEFHSLSLSVDKSEVGYYEYFTFTINIDPIDFYERTEIKVASGYEGVVKLSKTEFYFGSCHDNEVNYSTSFVARCVDDNGITHTSNEVIVKIKDETSTSESISIYLEKDTIEVNESITVKMFSMIEDAENRIVIKCLNDPEAFQIEELKLTALKAGEFKIQGEIENVKSDIVILKVIEDPYFNVNRDEFYTNYIPACSAEDAYFRSKHYLISGDITPQVQEPTIATYQPRENGMLIHNSSKLYSSNKDVYYVLDENGNKKKEIYKVGAYVSLEDVASYVYAFGDVPANYIAKTSSKSLSSNPWGKYLRLNNNPFSGDTRKYKFEPELPRISGCGGDLIYYEIDIGTTGTDCDPKYPPAEYNNGNRITRGGARIVYSRYYASDGDEITNLDDRYVFYTYNHYNDFQEYLNYLNGWGLMFGNKSAGNGPNEIDIDNPPTSYIESVRVDSSK